jgi:WD40 repeat protein
MSEYVPSIGIDFGTTNSSVAWRDPRTGDAEVILNAEGQPKTPSLVHFADDDETLVGKSVENLLQDISTDKARRDDVFRRTIASIKRNLLSPPRIALPGGRYVRPVEAAAEILKKIKRDAEDGHFHEAVERAVITCPAEFNVLQRQKIEEAGRLAGFSEVVLLEEPVAGALAYAEAGLDVGRHVLVYDLGGGTFDLAVLDSEDESFHVAMEPKGVERCGGDDFDLALYHHCDEVANETLGRPISLSGSVDLSFLRACRRRKESLTFQGKGRFSNYLSSENGPVYFEHEMDRQTFEELIGEYVETSARLTSEILKQADGAGHEVDTVVLVGGSVRVPLVVQTLKETLPVAPLGFNKRDIAVALGAAHYASVLWGEKKPSKVSKGSSAPRRGGVPAPPKPSPAEQYESAVAEARGKRLGKVEADRLSAFARQLGMTREATREVEVRVLGSSKEGVLYGQYKRAVETVWADGKLAPLEVEWLAATAEGMGLDTDRSSRAESEVMGDAKDAILARQSIAPESVASRPDFILAHTLPGHTGEVHSVAFSPDGGFLASGSGDHTLRGWDARAGEAVGSLEGHTARVNSVAFSPDGGFLASGGFDKSVRLWKLPNGEPFHNLAHPEWVFSVAVGSDGKLLASGGADGEIKLWSLETGELLRSLVGHSHWVLSVAMSADGGLLASGGADGTARVWDFESGEAAHVFERPGWVRSVAFGEEILAAACEDGSVGVWKIPDGELLYAVAGHSGAAFSVAASADGRLLASGGADGKVKVWDARAGEPLSILPAHQDGVSSVAFSPDGSLIASGGHDREVKVWRKVSGLSGDGAESGGRVEKVEADEDFGERGTSRIGMPPTLPD